MAYTRWYDVDPRLSEFVHCMERMSRQNQVYFADKLLDLSEQLLKQHGEEQVWGNLADDKMHGLTKARAKKRWYDRDEKLYQAFNNLFVLSQQDRRKIAAQLEVPARLVAGYEAYCERQDTQPMPGIVLSMLRSYYLDGEERTLRLYSIYVTPPEAEHTVTAGQKAKKSGPAWSELFKSLQSAMDAKVL